MLTRAGGTLLLLLAASGGARAQPAAAPSPGTAPATVPATVPDTAAASPTEPASIPALVEAALGGLGLSPRCAPRPDGAVDCRYRGRSSMTARDFQAHAVIRSASATVELYVADFLRAPADAPGTTALLNRLMELNGELLGAHFTWLAQTGEVRLVAVMHTDSNFDRRTFRSLVRTLDRIAPRYHRELLHLLQGDAAPTRR